ncbi:MAG: hypothetical protein ACRC2J_13365, partial [Microcoleaceae cyanobacterium]
MSTALNFPSPNNQRVHTELAQAPTSAINSTDNMGGQIATALPISLTLFGIILFIWFINNFLQICKPNEILILSGRKRKTSDGQEMGYRIIFG